MVGVCDVGELWEKIIVVREYESSIPINIALRHIVRGLMY